MPTSPPNGIMLFTQTRSPGSVNCSVSTVRGDRQCLSVEQIGHAAEAHLLGRAHHRSLLSEWAPPGGTGFPAPGDGADLHVMNAGQTATSHEPGIRARHCPHMPSLPAIRYSGWMLAVQR